MNCTVWLFHDLSVKLMLKLILSSTMLLKKNNILVMLFGCNPRSVLVGNKMYLAEWFQKKTKHPFPKGMPQTVPQYGAPP